MFHVLMHIPKYSPEHNRTIELQRDEQKTQDVSSEYHHTSICESKRGCGGLACKEKVISVLKLLGPTLPVHRFLKKTI